MAEGKVLVLNAIDTVAVALAPLAAGDTVTPRGSQCAGTLVVKMPIPTGHKVALCRMERGATVIKYGQPVGIVTQDIAVGEHVHIHNVVSTRAA